MKAKLQSLVLGPVMTNVYFLENPETKELILIDPADAADRISRKISDMEGKPVAVLLTHGHFDHILALDEVRKKYAVPVYSEEEEEAVLENPEWNLSGWQGLSVSAKADRLLKDGDVLRLAGMEIQVLHTPGHSPGSVSLLDRENRLLFTGDMCNDSLLLNCGDSSSTVKVYNESMRRLWAREQEFDAICLGHDALDKCDKTFILDYIEGTDKLISGEARGETGKNALHSGTGYHYKRVLIWYDPEKLV